MAHIDQAEDDIIEGSPEVDEEQVHEEDEKVSQSFMTDKDLMDTDEVASTNVEEDEYEIERIIRAKRGIFKQGQWAYLVKWKNFDESENSWVSEKDAENARELIDEYWERTNKANKQAKAPGRKSKTAEGESTRRGRGRPTSERLDTPQSDRVDGSDDDRPRKKSRRSIASESVRTATPSEDMKPVLNGKGASKRPSLSALNHEDDDEDDMRTGNWEDLVKSITTVEMSGKELMVYFETVDGQLVREPSRVCARHFPLKLIQFYESHLKWRAAPKK